MGLARNGWAWQAFAEDKFRSMVVEAAATPVDDHTGRWGRGEENK
jgi:hypothetical protein